MYANSVLQARALYRVLLEEKKDGFQWDCFEKYIYSVAHIIKRDYNNFQNNGKYLCLFYNVVFETVRYLVELLL